MKDVEIIESVLCIYLYTQGSFLKLDFKGDNLEYLLKEELKCINNFLGKYGSVFIDKGDIKFEYKDFYKLLELGNDYLKLFSFLGIDFQNKLTYIDLEFSDKFKKIIFLFFKFINSTGHKSKLEYLDYISNINNFKLREMLLFLVYGIGNDTEYNTTKSINILSGIIDKYPNFASFYLLRMRQMFNLVYKILIGTYKFNKLVKSEKGKIYLLENKFIKKCFEDLDNAEKLSPDFYITNLFKGKILLHLLDKDGLVYVEKYLGQIKQIFDMNVFSWFGVYFLQKGDLINARKYLTLVKYSEEDRYKSYSKLLFLYLSEDNKKDYLKFLNKNKGNRLVLLYNKGKYYKFENGKFHEWKDIDDTYNHRDKMGFKLNDFEKIFNTRFNDKNEYLNAIFNNISRNYYDHWYSGLEKKVIFYSIDNYRLG